MELTARATAGSARIRYSTYTVRNGVQTGWENSQTTSRPPGRVTRCISRERRVDVDHVAQPERDRDRVESVVPERQPGRVGGGEPAGRDAARLPTRSMPRLKSAGTTCTPAASNGSLLVPVPAARSSTTCAGPGVDRAA